MRSFRKLMRLAGLGFFALPALAAAQSGGDDCDQALAASPAFRDVSDIFSAILAQPALHCTHATQNSCAGPKLDTRWHFRAVDADLMQGEMEVWRKKAKAPARQPIAIVDGLFGPHLKELLPASPVEQLSRTKFGPELSGHASQTAQFLGGPAGLGVAPGNPIVAYDVALDREAVNPAVSDKAALDACAAGQRVINMSLNVNKRSQNPARGVSDLVVALANKGCVLVKAAGNDAIQDESTLLDYVSDFPLYLSVGATRRSGGIAGFSDLGDIYAPGQDLGVILPPSQIVTCGTPKAEGVLGGTSFAAPIVSAITSQVLEVLQTSPKFRALSPLEQTRTVVRTVRSGAEVPTGNVSGLRAVRSAMSWVAEKDGGSAPPVPRNCGEIPGACVHPGGTEDCALEAACSRAFRTALSLCPERLGQKPIEAFLGATAVDPWLGIRVMDTLSGLKGAPGLPAVRKILAENYNEAYWRRNFALQKPPFPELGSFLDLYSRVRLRAGAPEASYDQLIISMALRLEGDRNIVASSFVNDLLRQPEYVERVRRGVVEEVVRKRRIYGPPAITLVEKAMGADSTGGGEERDRFALAMAKGLPEADRELLGDYLQTLTLGKKRLGNTEQVVDAAWEKTRGMSFKAKIGMRAYLQKLEDQGRANSAAIARWRAGLDR